MDNTAHVVLFDGLLIPKEDVYKTPVEQFKQPVSLMKFSSPSENGLKDIINEKKQIVMNQFSKLESLQTDSQENITTGKSKHFKNIPFYSDRSVNFGISVDEFKTVDDEDDDNVICDTSTTTTNNNNVKCIIQLETYPEYSSPNMYEKRNASKNYDTEVTDEPFYCKIDPSKLILTDIDYLMAKCKWYFNNINDFENNSRTIERITYLDMFTQCFSLRDFNNNLSFYIEENFFPEYYSNNYNCVDDNYGNYTQHNEANYNLPQQEFFNNVAEKENYSLFKDVDKNNSPIFNCNISLSAAQNNMYFDSFLSQIKNYNISPSRISNDLLVKQEVCDVNKKNSNEFLSLRQKCDDTTKNISKSCFTTRKDTKKSVSRELAKTLLKEINESRSKKTVNKNSSKCDKIEITRSNSDRNFNKNDISYAEKNLNSSNLEDSGKQMQDVRIGISSTTLKSKDQSQKYVQFEDKGIQCLVSEDIHVLSKCLENKKNKDDVGLALKSNNTKIDINAESNKIETVINKDVLSTKVTNTVNDKSTNTDSLFEIEILSQKDIPPLKTISVISSKKKNKTNLCSQTALDNSVSSSSKKNKSNLFSLTAVVNDSDRSERINKDFSCYTMPFPKTYQDRDIDKFCKLHGPKQMSESIQSNNINNKLSKNSSFMKHLKNSTVMKTTDLQNQTNATKEYKLSQIKKMNVSYRKDTGTKHPADDTFYKFLPNIKEKEHNKQFENESEKDHNKNIISNTLHSTDAMELATNSIVIVSDVSSNETKNNNFQDNYKKKRFFSTQGNKTNGHLLRYIEGDNLCYPGRYAKSSKNVFYNENNLQNDEHTKKMHESCAGGDNKLDELKNSSDCIPLTYENENFYILNNNCSTKYFESDTAQNFSNFIKTTDVEGSVFNSSDSALLVNRVKKYKNSRKVRKMKRKYQYDRNYLKPKNVDIVLNRIPKQEKKRSVENVYINCWKRFCIIL